MKLVHSNKDLQNPQQILAAAQQYEQDSQHEEAVNLYLKLLKKQALNEKIYDRLMILYRKMKDPKKEMDIIKSGIKAFEEHYGKRNKTTDKKISRLSAALMKSTGLADKRGKSLYAAEPIGKWQRRQILLEKRMKK